MCNELEGCTKLHLQGRDGSVWTIDEVLPGGVVKMHRERSEYERLVLGAPLDQWGFCEPPVFRAIFGVQPFDVLEGWL